MRFPLVAAPGIEAVQRRNLQIINADLALRVPEIVGVWFDGTDYNVRFKVPMSVPAVQVHWQSTRVGEGGATYNAASSESSTEVSCRGSRVQDATIAAEAGVRHFLFIVPLDENQAGTVVKFDGVDSDDLMAVVELAFGSDAVMFVVDEEDYLASVDVY